MATLFISDLHLDNERPAITGLFADLVRERAASADALYILGDLFEAWIGDDDPGEPGRTVAAALSGLREQGVPVYFVHGNRDFLLGERFAERCGLILLPEESVIDLYGTPTLIMHGDSLCTDDVEYQQFRARVRTATWRQQVLSLPLDERRRMASQFRNDSRQATGAKTAEITDVNPQAVAAVMESHGVTRLIHGHTHRPAIHDFKINNRPARRIVLGDWYEQGSVLSCDADGCRLESLPPR